MANYAATTTSSEHNTAALAAAGLETLLEAIATTLVIRAADVIKIHENAFLAYVVTSDATV